MTNAEAKNWLKRLYIRADITDEYGDIEDMQPYEEAVNMAIKSLDIIDKIREEIAQYKRITYSTDPYNLVGYCLGIIDKYRKESEDKE